jgi:hypothetical protein
MRLVGIVLVVLASSGCAMQAGDPSTGVEPGAAETAGPSDRPVGQPSGKTGVSAVPVEVAETTVAGHPTTAAGGASVSAGGSGGSMGSSTPDNPNPSPWNTGGNTSEPPDAGALAVGPRE